MELLSGRVRGCPPLPAAAGRWLPSRARFPRRSRPRRLGSCGDIDRPLWHGLLTAYALCLERLLPGRARHLTVPSTSPCTSCGCGCFDIHAHIHSWCTTNLAFAASLRFSCQNSGARTPRSPVTAPPLSPPGRPRTAGSGTGTVTPRWLSRIIVRILPRHRLYTSGSPRAYIYIRCSL